jgi:serine/threonine protein kinase
MSDLIKRRKRITEPETRFYINQLMAGVAYLHDNCIIHRDLKLGNLFLDENMNIKIGDFGLATKLTHPSERKRTVCGTPNYIAPEILEGKDGHSFEVDTWSVGVIVYAMIVGRPPFECKDVKSTYKKILSNTYEYPDSVVVCDLAKMLISEILQTRPEKRLTVAQIRDHQYFRTGFTPTWLPTTALTQIPEMCNTAPTSKVMPPKGGISIAPINDENDRQASNRILNTAATGESGKPSSNPFIERKVMAEVNTNRSFKLRSAAENDIVEKPSSAGQPRMATRAASAMHLRPDSASSKPAAVVSEQPAPAAKYSAPVASNRVASGGATSIASNPVRSSGVVPTRDIKLAKPKFEIFSDTNDQENVDSNKRGFVLSTKPELKRSSSNNWATSKPEEPVNDQWKSAAVATVDRRSSTEEKDIAADCDGSDEVGLDKLDWDMDKMNLDGRSGRTSEARRDSVESNECRQSGDLRTPVGTTRQMNRPLRTLEAIHDTLNQSFVASNAVASVETLSRGASDIWVVRYMDYTNKYGLGYLLNNGCAGVYFNDSTKIIMSADGTVFQYFERKRRGTGISTSESDHTKMTYFVSSYPSELNKKVTLLGHFREYLLDKKTPGSAAVPEGNGNLVPLAPTPLPAPISGTVPWTSAARGSSLSKWEDMPYLKKWVRTRHAVLLRLSNRSVQVSFFDKT